MSTLSTRRCASISITSSTNQFTYDLNPAIGKFAGYARHQWRRRINILQVIDNAQIRQNRVQDLGMSTLNEQQRRWYVALESFKIGRGRIELMNQITGMDQKTIRRGRKELEINLEGCPMNRVRLEGGGRPTVEKKRLPLMPLSSGGKWKERWFSLL